MDGINYVDQPPPKRGAKPPNPHVDALLEAAQQKPGVWAEWRTEDESAYKTVGTTLHQRKNKAYSTPGLTRFESVTRKHPEGGFAVYVRWPEPEDGDE